MEPYPRSHIYLTDRPTSQINTLSLHDALPIFKNTFADIEYILTTCAENGTRFEIECYDIGHLYTLQHFLERGVVKRSEEHTSELQSRPHLVCRLLLEKKKTNKTHQPDHRRQQH